MWRTLVCNPHKSHNRPHMQINLAKFLPLPPRSKFPLIHEIGTESTTSVRRILNGVAANQPDPAVQLDSPQPTPPSLLIPCVWFCFMRIFYQSYKLFFVKFFYIVCVQLCCMCLNVCATLGVVVWWVRDTIIAVQSNPHSHGGYTRARTRPHNN